VLAGCGIYLGGWDGHKGAVCEIETRLSTADLIRTREGVSSAIAEDDDVWRGGSGRGWASGCTCECEKKRGGEYQRGPPLGNA
jgi:hypothetical protein